MKKCSKALFALISALVLTFCLTPLTASAAPPDNTAYLGFCDATYKYIYLGDPLTGVEATTATVTGVGQYTVGLDFTGTPEGKAVGASAVLPVIQLGEVSFPGYFIQLDSIAINGEDVSFTKGYTSVDDKGTTMSYSIFNAWAGVLPTTTRTPDGDLSAVSSNIVDSSVFKEVKTIFVTFTLLDAEGNGPVQTATDAAASDTDAAADTDTSATGSTDSSSDIPKTGAVSYALIYGTGAILTGAAAMKRRTK